MATRDELSERLEQRIEGLFGKIICRLDATIKELRSREPKRGIEDEYESEPKTDPDIRLPPSRRK